ncbi:hypothetical protein ACHQM5_018341 [Ranunculus cassubicifolius]
MKAIDPNDTNRNSATNVPTGPSGGGAQRHQGNNNNGGGAQGQQGSNISGPNGGGGNTNSNGGQRQQAGNNSHGAGHVRTQHNVRPQPNIVLHGGQSSIPVVSPPGGTGQQDRAGVNPQGATELVLPNNVPADPGSVQGPSSLGTEVNEDTVPTHSENVPINISEVEVSNGNINREASEQVDAMQLDTITNAENNGEGSNNGLSDELLVTVGNEIITEEDLSTTDAVLEQVHGEGEGFHGHKHLRQAQIQLLNPTDVLTEAQTRLVDEVNLVNQRMNDFLRGNSVNEGENQSQQTSSRRLNVRGGRARGNTNSSTNRNEVAASSLGLRRSQRDASTPVRLDL